MAQPDKKHNNTDSREDTREKENPKKESLHMAESMRACADVVICFFFGCACVCARVCLWSICVRVHLRLCVRVCACVLVRIHAHCNRLQQTATDCNTPQHTATRCNALQRPATHYNTLQHIATRCMEVYERLRE